MNTKTLNIALSACAAASVIMLAGCGGGSADDGVKTVARTNTSADSNSNSSTNGGGSTTVTCGTSNVTCLVSFDETPAKAVLGFAGSEASAISDGAPAGGNLKTLKIIRTGGKDYAGVKVTVGSISTTATNNTITARFYSPTANIPVTLKLENSVTDPVTNEATVSSGDIKSNEAVKVGWQTLTWTVPTSKLGLAYTSVVILPNLGTVASVNPGETYYVDDVTLSSGSSVTPTPAIALPVSFDESPAPTFIGFNGAEGSTIETGPNGGDKKALKIVRKGGEVYAGAKVNVGTITLTTTNNTISGRVYAPTAGKPFVIKLENYADNTVKTDDIAANEKVVAGWQTLTWTVPTNKFASNYNAITLLPNLGTLADATTGETYYVDDLKQIASTTPTPTPTPTPTTSALASFDESPALTFLGFEGAEGSAIETGPTGGDKKALKILRKGGMVYAGAKVNVGTIGLTSTSNKISARVYSPTAGLPFVLKLENYADGNITTGDVKPNETVVTGWQTLTWSIPSDKIASNYTAVTFLPNLGTVANATTGETYYVDDVKLLGSVTPPTPSVPELVVVSGYTALTGSGENAKGGTTEGGEWAYYSGNFVDYDNTYTGSDSTQASISITKKDTANGQPPSNIDQAYLGINNFLKPNTGGVTLSGQTKIIIEIAVDKDYLTYLNQYPTAKLRINVDGAETFVNANKNIDKCTYGVLGYVHPTSTALTKYEVPLTFGQGCDESYYTGSARLKTLEQVLARPMGKVAVTAASPYYADSKTLDPVASINAFVKNANNVYVTGFSVGKISFK